MKKLGLIYVGSSFFGGVPARDLTADEVANLPKQYNREMLVESGLYAEPKSLRAPKKTSSKSGAK